MRACPTKISVAIACGGTGGHLFPGQAVAEALLEQGCAVTLFVSAKEVDREAARSLSGVRVVTLPAVGLTLGGVGRFLGGSWKSFGLARRFFREQSHQAVLAMGGFTSAPPVIAGRLAGAVTFLHESNSIPGRANRWLAPWVDAALLGFPQAAQRLKCARVEVIGTPVRPQFQPGSPASARRALGLDPLRSVLLVMGGSQGAAGVNELVLRSLEALRRAEPDLQLLHLTGRADFERIQAAYRGANLKSVVRPFLTEMELALDAATVALSRAGASSLAELAAMRVPSVLVPYPFAADNHQFHNARAFVETGAARMLVQKDATVELLVSMVSELMRSNTRREEMRQALGAWHHPGAAARAAEVILDRLGIKASRREAADEPAPPSGRAISPPPPSSALCGLKP
jgi:UDP-N-acetylglucosamine--N-acetylmuramyl-(pentapeptide) pyrophosphoryl-undecaprenol N-acetylglucosamine transferase